MLKGRVVLHVIIPHVRAGNGAAGTARPSLMN